jgi:hypothetical protein
MAKNNCWFAIKYSGVIDWVVVMLGLIIYIPARSGDGIVFSSHQPILRFDGFDFDFDEIFSHPEIWIVISQYCRCVFPMSGGKTMYSLKCDTFPRVIVRFAFFIPVNSITNLSIRASLSLKSDSQKPRKNETNNHPIFDRSN